MHSERGRLRRTSMRLELCWTRRRAGVLADDRRKEQRLRDEALRAGREQVLAALARTLVLMDEHPIVGIMALPLAAVEAVDLDLGARVAVRVTTATGRVTVPLSGTSPAAAARFADTAWGAIERLPDVRAVYDARRNAGIAKVSGRPRRPKFLPSAPSHAEAVGDRRSRSDPTVGRGRPMQLIRVDL